MSTTEQAGTEQQLRAMYAAFNARDITAALTLMSEDVSWPKASEGGRVLGKDKIRAYWTRQWAEYDPRVEPVSIDTRASNTTVVLVHQVVRDRTGALLSDEQVTHTYTFKDGLIARMDVEDSGSTFARDQTN